ncbi:6229_t:CDS:2 [Dentiscutata erythropus]|uniref:6229_t:CDS:1 n=1 Tax=Dentiscutata erythropus TaxID=1348616 RepID=A0A9N9DAN3_9GLOM|nr:6229_t:CDS:2 [Dentiscutata erythropus]
MECRLCTILDIMECSIKVIENQIRLQDEIQNRANIEQKFKEGREIIDEIEEANIEKHGYYRYNYHIKYASYLKTIGEVERSSRQKTLAKRFEQNVKNLEPEDICEAKLKSTTVINEVFNPGGKYTQEVEKKLEEIKEGNHNTPISLKDEHKNLGEELFKHILKSKRRLLADLENVIHEEKAFELWKIAIDYRNAAEGKWNKLGVLNQREINKYTSEELRRFSVTNGKLAFDEYREACKLADEKNIKKQIKLRENMALSAIRMFLIKCSTQTPQDYIEIKKILEKVKGNSHTSETSDNITLELEKVGQTNSFYGKLCYQHSIDKDIEKIISELMLKPDRSLIQCKSSPLIESTLYYIICSLSPLIAIIMDCWNEPTYDSILRLNKPGSVIDPTKIIKICREHYIKSDCIAYLLNSIGEVLISQKIQIDGKNANDLKVFAKSVFHGVLDEDLVKDSEKLDYRIRELRKKEYHFSQNFYFRGFMKTQYKSFTEDAENARKMPFVSRLEEIRNIARINFATLDMLNPSSEATEQTVKTINEIRKSIYCNYQFIGTTKLRLETLKDFLWVINGKETSEEMPEEFPEESTDSTPFKNADTKYIVYLNEQLEQTSSQSERIKIYKNMAIYFEHLAEIDWKVNKLNSLRHWNSAQKNYENTREIDPENLVSALGYTKCLLKYIAYYKQVNYEKSNGCIIEALRLDPKNELADKQISFLKKLRAENSSEYRINQYKRKKVDMKYEEGGIRGILPTLWLSEIEYRTRRPISHLFNMITGTSTGGIVAAGLSAPSHEYPDFKPKFSASELLNTYQDHTKKLFTMNKEWNSKAKYINEGHSNLFEEYFGQTKLSHALTELVIPAINEADSSAIHLFTRNDARKDELKNDTFIDALMAATSIPTFFSPYEIRHESLFIDGGMHINNPALTSFNEAIRYNVESKKIFILSLGTGSYIPDPSKPILYRDKNFWASNQFTLSNDENEVDRQMHLMLKDRYQRWQVSFEDPIKLDDFERIPYLVEIGHQYLEELYDSDEILLTS